MTDSSGKIIWGDLELFLLLGRTQRMLRFKLLGNHKIKGDFKIRLTQEDEIAIRSELDLGQATSGPAFNLCNFLSKLNGLIPLSIPLEEKIAVIRADREPIKANCESYLDQAEKIYLLRAAPLPPGKNPREETLRKLYMLDAAIDDVAALIRNLKRVRWTTYWTAVEPNTDKFAEIFTKVARASTGQ